MTVKERILTLRLLEKQKKNPELAKKLGINVKMKNKKTSQKQYYNKRSIKNTGLM